MVYMDKLMAGPIGSFLKVFVGSMLLLIYNGGSIYNIDWQTIVGASIISAIPVLLNYINPEYEQYGFKKEEEI